MDCSRTEVQYLLVVTQDDVDSFDKDDELYFETRDNTDDEEACDLGRVCFQLYMGDEGPLYTVHVQFMHSLDSRYRDLD